MVAVKVALTLAATRDTVLKCATWADEGSGGALGAPRECGALGHLHFPFHCGDGKRAHTQLPCSVKHYSQQPRHKNNLNVQR